MGFSELSPARHLSDAQTSHAWSGCRAAPVPPVVLSLPSFPAWSWANSSAQVGSHQFTLRMLTRPQGASSLCSSCRKDGQPSTSLAACLLGEEES